MSMSPEQEIFKQLRRLLVLKRYEQPPPGYFKDFSHQVIIRIQAGERVEDSIFERLHWEAPWLHRLWTALEAKPILAGAFGVAVCGLLISGIVYSEKMEPAAASFSSLPTPEPSELGLMAAQEQPPAESLFPGAPRPSFSNTGSVTTLPNRASIFTEVKEMQRPWVVPIN